MSKNVRRVNPFYFLHGSISADRAGDGPQHPPVCAQPAKSAHGRSENGNMIWYLEPQQYSVGGWIAVIVVSSQQCFSVWMEPVSANGCPVKCFQFDWSSERVIWEGRELWWPVSLCPHSPSTSIMGLSPGERNPPKMGFLLWRAFTKLRWTARCLVWFRAPTITSPRLTRWPSRAFAGVGGNQIFQGRAFPPRCLAFGVSPPRTQPESMRCSARGQTSRQTGRFVKTGRNGRKIRWRIRRKMWGKYQQSWGVVLPIGGEVTGVNIFAEMSAGLLPYAACDIHPARKCPKRPSFS